MMSVATSNQAIGVKRANKAEQAQQAFAQLLADASRRGFYGAGTLSFSVQDGSLQQLKVTLEKVIR